MNLDDEHKALLTAGGEGHLIPDHAPTTKASPPAPRKMSFGQRIVAMFLLTLVLAPSLAGFYSYFWGFA